MNEEKVFDDYLRNELSEENSLLLLDRLSTDEEFSERLLDHVYTTHLMLKSASSTGVLQQKCTERIKTVKHKKRKESRSAFPTVLKFVSAALLLIGFLMMALINNRASNSFKLNAFTSNKGFYYKGYTPTEGKNKLGVREVLEFKNAFGTRVILEGPAVFEIISDHLIDVEKGKVSVLLTEKSQSFELKTPHGIAKDLGTAFGCEVLVGETELHVFEGVVEFGEQKTRAYKGDAYSLSNRQLQEITYNSGKFLKEVLEIDTVQRMNLLAGESITFALDRRVENMSLKLSPKDFSRIQGSFEFQVLADGKLIKNVSLETLKGFQKLTLKDLSSVKNLSFSIESDRDSGIDDAAGNLDIKIYDLPLRIPEVLVPNSSSWLYYKAALNPVSDWYKKKHSPNSWLRGKAPIGFRNEVNTELEDEDSPLYVYKEFFVKELPEQGVLLLSHCFDDGGIVYLNGHEIYRDNILDEFVDQDSRTEERRKSSTESVFNTVKIPLTYLKKGKNVIAAVVCQYHKNSGDMFFDLKIMLQK